MPEAADVRIDMTLTNFVREYKFTQAKFFADEVAPPVDVTAEYGHYKLFGMEEADIDIEDIVGERTKTNEIDFDVGDTTYTVKEKRLAWFLSDRASKNAPNKLALEKRGVRRLKYALLLREEYRVRELADATSNAAATSQDWDHADATIVADILTGIGSFVAKFGMEPNGILFGSHIAREIIGQADIQDLLKYSAAMSNPLEMLSVYTQKKLPKEIAGLRTMVSNVMYNSAHPGLTRTLVNVWGDNAYLFYIDKETESGSWARQFERTPIFVVKWRNDDPPGTFYRVMRESVAQETCAEAVWEITDVT